MGFITFVTMAITYTWNTKTVDVYPTYDEHSDVIFNVHWYLTGTDENDITASVYGTQQLDTSDLSDFTSFDDVTEAKCTEWTKTSMGAEKVAELESNIASQIEEKINPSVETKTLN